MGRYSDDLHVCGKERSQARAPAGTSGPAVDVDLRGGSSTLLRLSLGPHLVATLPQERRRRWLHLGESKVGKNMGGMDRPS